MCCKNSRDLRQLQTMFWRVGTVIRRNKLKALKQGWVGYVLYIILQFLLTQYNPDPIQLKATDGPIVTSTTPSQDQNYFYNTTSGFSTDLTFLNCTLYKAYDVGLVKPSSNTAEANAMLDAIYQEIHDLYSVNSSGLGELRPLIFDSMEQMDDHVREHNYPEKMICFALSWAEFEPSTHQFDLQLSFNFDFLPQNRLPQAEYEDSLKNFKYLKMFGNSGFLQIMTTATDKIIKNVYNTNGSDFQIMYMNMDSPVFYQDGFSEVIAFFLPLIFEAIGHLGLAILVITHEYNEDKITSILERIGMRKSVIFYQDTIIHLVFTLVFMPPVAWAAQKWMIPSVSFELLLSSIVLFQCNEYFLESSIEFLLPHHAHRPVKVILRGVTFFIQINSIFLTGLTPLWVNLTSILPHMQLTWVCLLSTISFNKTITLDFDTFHTDITGTGVSIGSVFEVAASVLTVLIIILLYLWPLKIAVDPNRPLPFFYLCSRKFWKSEDARKDAAVHARLSGGISDSQRQLLGLNDASQETSGDDLLTAEEREMVANGRYEELNGAESSDRLILTNLLKKYGKHEEPAVDLTMTMFKNEILVLLGHNGAGKTTTLNMLSGLVEPTSGQATALGINILANFRQLQDFIGVCPQEEILMGKLTVYENIQFVCMFKGLDNKHEVITKCLSNFHLQSRAFTLAKDLSLGEKRQLQIAIALLGDSKIILLDEPTSGMDPAARRATWEIIKQIKKDKIVILTTQYMDEAEELADRVAIISQGRLQTCGSTLFMKQNFGQGYFLEVTPIDAQVRVLPNLAEMINKYIEQSGHIQNTFGKKKTFLKEKRNIEAIFNYQAVQDHIEQDRVRVTHDSSKNQIVYQLPITIAPLFPEMFKEIDASASNLGIETYNVRTSTLEEVFIETGLDEFKQSTGHEISDERLSRTATGVVINGYRSFWQNTVFRLRHAKWKNTIIVTIIAMLQVCIVAELYSIVKQDPINYTNVESIYEEILHKEPELKIYYNPLDANGQSTDALTTPIFSAYEVLMAETYNTTGFGDQTVHSNLEQVGEELFEIGEVMEEEGEGEIFASYCVYQYAQDTTTNDWDISVAVYGNAASAAALPTFGNLMLNSVARSITGQNELKIQFTNRPLKINKVLLPGVNPAVASLFGLGILTAVSVVMIWNVEQFARPMSTGFYDAYLIRGGRVWAYLVGHLFVAILVNWLMYLIILGIMTAFGFQNSSFIYVFGIVSVSGPITSYFVAYVQVRGRGSHWNEMSGLFAQTILFIGIVGEFVPEILTKTQANEAVDKFVTNILAYTPTGALITGIEMILTRYETALLRANKKGDDSMDTSPYGMNGLGDFTQTLWILTIMHILNVCWYSSENRSCKRNRKKKAIKLSAKPGAEDVNAEKARVNNLGLESSQERDTIVVRNLFKHYEVGKMITKERNVEGETAASLRQKGTMAVNGISFGVKKGERLVLLGTNGSGRTTIFRCMTGYERPSNGSIFLDGINAEEKFFLNQEKMNSLIGYCPQNNCLNEEITVKETLNLFSDLAGIPTNQQEETVNSLIKRFCLKQYENKMAGNLSTGNKRKLCLAMAVIGKPKIILIDVVTAGIDPASRRLVWQAIKEETSESATVISSQSIEAAEYLSSKLAIMLDGKFETFGSLQDILKRHGQDFEIDFQIDLPQILEDIPREEMLDVVHLKTEVLEVLQQWQLAFTDKNLEAAFNFSDEFTQNGKLHDFWAQMHDGESIHMEDLRKAVLLQNCAMSIASEITNHISTATIQSINGTRVALKLEKNSKSVGAMYGLMEELKQKHPIKEYTCKQFTLEQVFNAFATKLARPEPSTHAQPDDENQALLNQDIDYIRKPPRESSVRINEEN